MSVEDRGIPNPFIGHSAMIRDLALEAGRVLAVRSPVLILGDTGTGKSVLARWLHANGQRNDGPFVELNCAGLSRSFLESELFGHEKGAFTGAVTSKPGLLEVASGGTVFLDEIGDMELRVQPKLLKVLEEKKFRRLGDVRDRYTDIRLIAATHQNLATRLRDLRFRSDLYFRISTIQLRVPSLRERREDIPALANAFLARLARDYNRPGVALASGAMAALQAHGWPGNLRELLNVLERTLLFSNNDVLRPGDLRFDEPTVSPGDPPTENDAKMSLHEVERLHIERVLRGVGGRVADAARLLGIPRSTLYQKIKSFQIAMSEI